MGCYSGWILHTDHQGGTRQRGEHTLDSDSAHVSAPPTHAAPARRSAAAAALQLAHDVRQPRSLRLLVAARGPQVARVGHLDKVEGAGREGGPALRSAPAHAVSHMQRPRRAGSSSAGRGAAVGSSPRHPHPHPTPPPTAAFPHLLRSPTPPHPTPPRTCTMASVTRGSRSPQKAMTGNPKGGPPDTSWRCSYSSNSRKSARSSGWYLGHSASENAASLMPHARHSSCGWRMRGERQHPRRCRARPPAGSGAAAATLRGGAPTARMRAHTRIADLEGRLPKRRLARPGARALWYVRRGHRGQEHSRRHRQACAARAAAERAGRASGRARRGGLL